MRTSSGTCACVMVMWCAKAALSTAYIHAHSAFKIQPYFQCRQLITSMRISKLYQHSSRRSFYASTWDRRGVSLAAGQELLGDNEETGGLRQGGEEAARQRQREELKAKLVAALQGVDRGFKATTEQRTLIHSILEELPPLTTVTSAAAEFLLASSSSWKLIYSNAPDIVGGGNEGLMLPRTGIIGQRFDSSARTVTNIVQRIPPNLLAGVVGGDSVVLRVVLTTEPVAPSRVRMRLKATSVSAGKLLNADASWLPPLQLVLPVTAPFGEFDILYLDRHLRVVKTTQGYWGVNVRVPLDELP